MNARDEVMRKYQGAACLPLGGGAFFGVVKDSTEPKPYYLSIGYRTVTEAWVAAASAVRNERYAPTAWEAEKARVLAAFPSTRLCVSETGLGEYRIEAWRKCHENLYTDWHATEADAWAEAARTWLAPDYVNVLPSHTSWPAMSDEQYVESVYPSAWCDETLTTTCSIWDSSWRCVAGSGSATCLGSGATVEKAWAAAAKNIRSRTQITDEQFVKSVYPNAALDVYEARLGEGLRYFVKSSKYPTQVIASGACWTQKVLGEGRSVSEAWRNARVFAEMKTTRPGAITWVPDASAQTDEQFVKSMYPEAGCHSYGHSIHGNGVVILTGPRSSCKNWPKLWDPSHDVLGRGDTVESAWRAAAHFLRTPVQITWVDRPCCTSPNLYAPYATGLTDTDLTRIITLWGKTTRSVRESLKTLVDCLPLKGE